MSAFTICALAALAFILTVAAIQVAAEDRRDRRMIRTDVCCCRTRRLQGRDVVLSNYFEHTAVRCQPLRERL